MRLLAKTLDPARYRIEALPCARVGLADEAAYRGLRDLGIDVDSTGFDLGFGDTVHHLAQKITEYEIIISCQNVADIFPALERLQYHPALIECGREVAEAIVGPKHFTTRYVAASKAIRAAAADRMTGRSNQPQTIVPPQCHAVRRPRWWKLVRTRLGFARPQSDGLAAQWQSLIEAVLVEVAALPHRLCRL